MTLSRQHGQLPKARHTAWALLTDPIGRHLGLLHFPHQAADEEAGLIRWPATKARSHKPYDREFESSDGMAGVICDCVRGFPDDQRPTLTLVDHVSSPIRMCTPSFPLGLRRRWAALA